MATLTQFLQTENHALGSLLTKLKLLNQWNAWLKESLPSTENLSKHCCIVNLDGTSLIVIADSPHWVTRLRFYIPELLPKLKKYPGLEKIRAICCKAQPPFYKTGLKKKRSPQTLSTSAAKTLRESAGKVSDKKLSEILNKIAGKADIEGA